MLLCAKLGAISSLGAVGAVDSLWSVNQTVRLCVIPWTAACQASLSIINSWSFLKLMSIESVMPSNLLILCHPSADEWIRKLWYINTMEYYSAIKNNTFESVLMKWMKLEPIIQSEVRQKEKHQYSILSHIYGI